MNARESASQARKDRSEESGLVKVLIVEDEPSYARVLQKVLTSQPLGCSCETAGTLRAARRALGTQGFEVVLLDVQLPDGNGLDLLREIRGSGDQELAVVLTSFERVADAVEAMKLGATDYLPKPEDPRETNLAVRKALQAAENARRLAYARTRDHHAVERVEMLGDSVAIQAVRREILRVADLGGVGLAPAPTVLIQGQTGTGKDLAARLIHSQGRAADRPFVQVDCAALPANLIESELFGHEKGSYTQAFESRSGLLEAAEDGTVFLDEIGELPLEVQGKLLTALDRRVVRRIGSNRERPIAARIVSATNRNLLEMVVEGRFRADLYYRLKVLGVDLPTLAERREDVPILARHFASDIARHHGLPEPRISAAALRALAEYDWPGNVRELRNLIERAVMLSQEGELGRGAFRLERETLAEGPQLAGRTLAEVEREMILLALEGAAGNVSRAARELGLTRATLRSRMRRQGLERAAAQASQSGSVEPNRPE